MLGGTRQRVRLHISSPFGNPAACPLVAGPKALRPRLAAGLPFSRHRKCAHGGTVATIGTRRITQMRDLCCCLELLTRSELPRTPLSRSSVESRSRRSRTVVRKRSSTSYYEEVRMIPLGSESEPGTPLGVGPGPCLLRRITLPHTPLHKGEKEDRGALYGVRSAAERVRDLRLSVIRPQGREACPPLSTCPISRS